MAAVQLAARFHALGDCLTRAAKSPALRGDPLLQSQLHDGERQLRELRQEVESLARVRDAFAGVRLAVGENAPVERLQAALLDAYQRAGPHLVASP
jgi:hypothetical protein